MKGWSYVNQAAIENCAAKVGILFYVHFSKPFKLLMWKIRDKMFALTKRNAALQVSWFHWMYLFVHMAAAEK